MEVRELKGLMYEYQKNIRLMAEIRQQIQCLDSMHSKSLVICHGNTGYRESNTEKAVLERQQLQEGYNLLASRNRRIYKAYKEAIRRQEDSGI